MYIHLSSYIYIYVSVYLAWIRTSESMPSPLPPSGLAPCPLGVAVVPPLPPKRSCGSFHPRGSPKWMVYKGRLFKVSDFGLPPFIQTPCVGHIWGTLVWKSGTSTLISAPGVIAVCFAPKQCAPLFADVETHVDDWVSDETRRSMMFFGGCKLGKNSQMTSEGDPKTSSESHGAERSPFAGRVGSWRYIYVYVYICIHI